jgi:hypothetical protein
MNVSLGFDLMKVASAPEMICGTDHIEKHNAARTAVIVRSGTVWTSAL